MACWKWKRKERAGERASVMEAKKIPMKKVYVMEMRNVFVPFNLHHAFWFFSQLLQQHNGIFVLQ
jgi:hypothetical protein